MDKDQIKEIILKHLKIEKMQFVGIEEAANEIFEEIDEQICNAFIRGQESVNLD